MNKKTIRITLAGLLSALVVLYFFYYGYLIMRTRSRKVMEFLRDPQLHQEWVTPALTRCGDAPFILPTSGLIGFLWDDSFRPGHRHQGIDIFGGMEVGKAAVYAAHDGYLSRLPEWRSSLIIRIPSDPLFPDRQIWTYYTHMADKEGNPLIVEKFPAGTEEKWVHAGTLLGYQGNYSGNPRKPTGIHLHFSIVLDDGSGKFLNELNINNTVDPSAYFGMCLNANENFDQTPICP